MFLRFLQAIRDINRRAKIDRWIQQKSKHLELKSYIRREARRDVEYRPLDLILYEDQVARILTIVRGSRQNTASDNNDIYDERMPILAEIAFESYGTTIPVSIVRLDDTISHKIKFIRRATIRERLFFRLGIKLRQIINEVKLQKAFEKARRSSIKKREEEQ